MTDLFPIPETVPPWKELKVKHGITTSYCEDSGTWCAYLDWFRTIEHESGETEQIAVNALIFRLRLT